MPTTKAQPAHQERRLPAAEGLVVPLMPTRWDMDEAEEESSVWSISEYHSQGWVPSHWYAVTVTGSHPPHGALSLRRDTAGTGAHVCSCSKPRAAFAGAREGTGSTGTWQRKLYPAGTRYAPLGPHLLVLL